MPPVTDPLSADPLRPLTAAAVVCELDDQDRPGPALGARTAGINRSRLVLLSRRMSYAGSRQGIALQMLDAEPTILLARVTSCAYDEDGLYRLELALLPRPKPELRGLLMEAFSQPART